MKQVLVLDANQRSALATTRSLGLQGVIIFTADDTPSSLAGSSRYSRQYSRYPSPAIHPDEFIASICKLVKALEISIIIPMTELTTNLLLQYRQALPEIILPFPDLKTIDSLADKCSLMHLAKKQQIPIPKTWFVNSPDNLPVTLTALPYPIILKPGKSWLFDGNKWIHTNVRIADTPEMAREILDTDHGFHTHPFMLQECVTGIGQGLFALYDKGKAVAFFTHRRLREKPPSGGVSVLSESVPIDPVLREHACSLLDSAKWHGIAMVEFKVGDDGTPYLMEINTRFWGSLQLAIDAGVDFPWLLYKTACGEPIKPVQHYKIGTRLRWLLGDLDSLYLSLRDTDNSILNKISAIKQFLTPAPFSTRHEVNRWHDIRPFWWELKQYVKDILK